MVTSASSSFTTRIKSQIVKSSSWTLSGQLISLGVSFFLTPFILRLFGAEKYGAFILSGIVANYLVFSDLGQGGASTRYGSESYAAGDDEREAAVVWTSLCIIFISTSCAALVLALGAPFLTTRFLNIPESLQEQAAWCIVLACIAFVAKSLQSVVNTPLIARLRFDLYTAINTGSVVLQTCLILLAVYLGGSITTAVAVSLGCALLAAALTFVSAFNLQKKLSESVRFEQAWVSKLLRFGMPAVVSSLIGTLLFHGERLLLAKISGVAALSYYTVAFTLAQLIDLIPVAISQTLLPVFTQLHSISNKIDLENLYSTIVRNIFVLLVPAAVIFCVWGQRMIGFWAGEEFARESSIALYVLVGGALLNAVAHFPRTLLPSLGYPAIVAKVHLGEVLPYIMAGIVLVSYFGVIGAAITWALRAVVECFVVFALSAKIPKISFQIISENWIGYCVSFIPLMILLGIRFFVNPSSAIILLCSAAFLILYFLLVWRLFLTAADRHRIYNLTVQRFAASRQ